MMLLSKIKKMCPTACDPLTVRNVVQFKNQKPYNHPPKTLQQPTGTGKIH